MFKYLIVDDEKPARNLLRSYLESYDNLWIKEAENGLEAVEMINEHAPDVVFLDVQMPGLNGFEVLPRLDKLPVIVFSTAFDQFALDAFNAHAVDYLLKPYAKDRLTTCMEKVLHWLKVHQNNQFIEQTINSQAQVSGRIMVNQGKSSITVNLCDISVIEAFGDYTKIHTIEQSIGLSNQGITKFEEQLGDQFIRIHRSYIINKNHFIKLEKLDGQFFLHVKPSMRIKIARSYEKEIVQIFVGRNI